MLAKFKSTQSTAKLCLDTQYMERMCKVFEDMYNRNQIYHPSVVICTSPGTGKTMFAYNLATMERPIAYFCLKETRNWEGNTAPFNLLSHALLDVINEDINLLYSQKNGRKYSRKYDIDGHALGTVSFLVQMFEKMAEKTDGDWFEAELSVQYLLKNAMLIEEGKARISQLFPDQPVFVFMDEFCTPNYGRCDDNDPQCLFNTILHKLKIIQIISTRYDKILREPEEYVTPAPLSRLVISSLPQFSLSLLIELSRKLKAKFNNHPTIKSIITFIQFCAEEENPSLIQSAFDFMDGLSLERLESTSLKTIVNEMLTSLFKTFLRQVRCEYGVSRAQLHYLNSFVWKKNVLYQSLDKNYGEWSNRCIHSHFGNLDVGTDLNQITPNSPHFWIGTDGHVMYDLGKSFKEGDYYRTASLYHSFNKTPLTGLMLFGIEYSGATTATDHGPFLAHREIGKRATAFDAVLEMRKDDTDMLNCVHFMDLTFRAAAVMGSRSNGPEGCKFAGFLGSVIDELRSLCDFRGNQFPEKTTEVLMDQTIFGDIIIPFLPPVPVAEWENSVAKFMQDMTECRCRLGTFIHSSAKDTVSHIILELHFDKKQDSSKIKTRISEKRHNKVASWPKLDKNMIKRVALITECIHSIIPCNLLDIEKVIVDKFEHLEANYILEFSSKTKSCSTFIIFAYRLENLLKECPQEYIHILKRLNSLKYYLWTLKATQKSEYSVVPVFPEHQCLREGDFKDVIMISIRGVNNMKVYYSFIENIERPRYMGGYVCGWEPDLES